MQNAAISDRERDRRVAWRVNDACAALGISRSHLYVLARGGKLRIVKIGNRSVVPDEDVQRLASKGASLPAPPPREERQEAASTA
jgi:excisionase family DNA binding protein